jgi:hypothetical protein
VTPRRVCVCWCVCVRACVCVYVCACVRVCDASSCVPRVFGPQGWLDRCFLPSVAFELPKEGDKPSVVGLMPRLTNIKCVA